MHAAPIYADPSIIPSSFFFSVRRGQTPTKAWAHKSQRGWAGRGGEGRGGDKGTPKCLVKADGAAESSPMLVQTDNVQKFPVKLMSRQFAFNIQDLGESLEAVLPLLNYHSYHRVRRHRGHLDTKDCQVQLCNSNDIHAISETNSLHFVPAWPPTAHACKQTVLCFQQSQLVGLT